MEGVNISVELVPRRGQSLALLFPFILDLFACGIQRISNLRKHVPFVGFIRMKFKAEAPQPNAPQSIVDDTQCRHLLGHEEYRLADGEAVCH